MLLLAALLPPAGEQNRQQPRGARGRVGRFGLKRKLLGRKGVNTVMSASIFASLPDDCIYLIMQSYKIGLRHRMLQADLKNFFYELYVLTEDDWDSVATTLLTYLMMNHYGRLACIL